MKLRLVPVLTVTLTIGCAKSDLGQTYPVRGMVSFEGQPLTAKSTTILLKPDVAGGNLSPIEPNGIVDESGQYKVITQGQGGAPPGRYKVIVTAYESPPVHHKRPGEGRPTPVTLLPAKYGLAETTPLAIEVVANPAPGAYDLKLSK
jgi:hypothetical protein